MQSPALLGGRAAGSNLANLPRLICWVEFNRVPVKPAEEVSTLQLFVFVPLRLLVTSIVLMQLLVRLHAEPGHWSKRDKNMLFWEGVIIKQKVWFTAQSFKYLYRLTWGAKTWAIWVGRQLSGNWRLHGLGLPIKPMPGGTAAGVIALLLAIAVLSQAHYSVGLSCDAGLHSYMYFVFFIWATCATSTPSSHGVGFYWLADCILSDTDFLHANQEVERKTR